MSLALSGRGVLADRLPRSAALDVALVGAGAGLIGLSAQAYVYLPNNPVPITGQTLGVLLVAAVLGPLRGTAASTLYVGAGLAGMPWFAGHASGFKLPTFGYLIGFVLASLVVGRLAALGGDRNPLVVIGTMLVGNAIIYGFGVTWLAFAVDLSPVAAIQMGMVPFLIGDAIKILMGAALLPSAWLLVKPRG